MFLRDFYEERKIKKIIQGTLSSFDFTFPLDSCKQSAKSPSTSQPQTELISPTENTGPVCIPDIISNLATSPCYTSA